MKSSSALLWKGRRLQQACANDRLPYMFKPKRSTNMEASRHSHFKYHFISASSAFPLIECKTETQNSSIGPI